MTFNNPLLKFTFSIHLFRKNTYISHRKSRLGFLQLRLHSPYRDHGGFPVVYLALRTADDLGLIG